MAETPAETSRFIQDAQHLGEELARFPDEDTIEPRLLTFLEASRDHAADQAYASLVEALWSRWRPRLAKLAPLRHLILAGHTVPRVDLEAASDLYQRFLGLQSRVPRLPIVVGIEHMCRHASTFAAFRAELQKSRRIASEAVDQFTQAATHLDALPNATLLDKADAAGFRSASLLASGFQRLRNRRGLKGQHFEAALLDFAGAAAHARRRYVFSARSRLVPNRRNLWRVRYWHHVAGVAVCNLRHTFDRARRHLALASAYAEQLGEIPTERWYLDIDDLRRDALVIDAYEALTTRSDLINAHASLAAWATETGDVQANGRRLRIYFRKLALDVLTTAKRKADPLTSSAFEELVQISKDARVLGDNEQFIANAIHSCIVGGVVSPEDAVALCTSAFIPGSTPARRAQRRSIGGAEDARCFRRLPALFFEWVSNAERLPVTDSRVPDKVAYALLLYVRSIAEFWSAAYRKRLAEPGGEIDRYQRDKQSVACTEAMADMLRAAEAGAGARADDKDVFPTHFGLTNWRELGACLRHLLQCFESQEAQQGLSALLESVERFEGEILPLVRKGLMPLSDLAAFVMSLILRTHDRMFPHPVWLKAYSPERASLKLDVVRAWQNTPTLLTLRRAVPKKYVVGRYYFLSPKYKRKPADQLEDTSVKLLPADGSTGFGVPSPKPVLLLVEGATDVVVCHRILSRYNPHWQACVDVRDRGGAANIEMAWKNFQDSGAYGEIVAVLDDVGGNAVAAAIQRRPGGYAYVLSPDLEGAHEDALVAALQQVRPGGAWTAHAVHLLVDKARTAKDQGTAKLIRDLERAQGFSDDESKLKGALAPALAEQFLRLDPPEALLDAIRHVLAAAFGHARR